VTRSSSPEAAATTDWSPLLLSNVSGATRNAKTRIFRIGMEKHPHGVMHHFVDSVDKFCGLYVRGAPTI